MKRLSQRKYFILADQAVFSGTHFLLTILMARHWDATAFGLYSACMLAAYLAMSAVSAWTVAVFQVAPKKTPQYASFVFWAQLLLVALGLVLFSSLNRIFQVYESNGPIVLGAGFMLHDFGRRFLIALGKAFEALILDSITALLLLTAFGMIQQDSTWTIQETLGFLGAVYATTTVLTLFFSKPFFMRRADIPVFSRQHINKGKWLFLSALSQWWAGNLIVVASGIYLGTAALAALRLAQSLFGVLNILLQTFEHYVLPQAALELSKDLSDGLHYLKKANQKLGLAFFPVLAVIFTFAEPIMVLSGGAQYAPYAFVLRGLCVLYMFILFSQPIRFAIRALQLDRHFFYGYLINLCFAGITSVWFLSYWGLSGVIMGLIAAQGLLIFYWTFILQQQKNINVWKSYTSY